MPTAAYRFFGSNASRDFSSVAMCPRLSGLANEGRNQAEREILVDLAVQAVLFDRDQLRVPRAHLATVLRATTNRVGCGFGEPRVVRRAEQCRAEDRHVRPHDAAIGMRQATAL